MERQTTILGLAAAALLAVAPAASAQTATVYGQLGNFDVVNNTGQDAHGFEIELDGLQPADVYYAFSYQRYGAPQIVASPTGVRVRWTAPYAGGAFTATTIPHAPGTPFGGTCYMGTQNYDVVGCEHFGVSLNVGAPTATYRWLIDDPLAPGTLVPVDPPVAVAQPYYYVAPPVAANPPVVVVEVQAPEPPAAPSLYGDAQWIKVFVTQLPREVALDELMTVNPLVVPMNAAQTEVNWDILQAQPVGTSGGNGNKQSRGRKRYQGGLDPTTRSVVRRIELYSFTGTYDPLTHEAICADLTCTAPGTDELGDFISAQMTAVNVQADSVTVTKVGNGTVDSADKKISCGSKCASPYVGGTLVTLTAKAGSGSVFSGWMGGGCTGVGTCTVTATGSVAVSATFSVPPAPVAGGGGGGAAGGGTTAASYKISISKNGKGTVVAAPSAASYPAGTVVTLTATPDPGSPWNGWAGACSGTAKTCSVTMNANLSVTANFK